MAKATGMSQSAVSRIWRAFGLKPHLVETFKLSPDPLFVDKVRDIVGLYVNPPEAALVLCVDEKTQIQALDRTSPVLPLRPGLPERRTHDYLRGGTTNLYAALDVASGHVIADMSERHRAVEFRRFLNLINRNVPNDLDVHLVVDNVSTHKTPEIKKWLVRHPRFHLHFTPTYSSWINLVERWFAELTNKWLRRGTHRSTKELESSINEWIEHWNDEPKPFVWHKSADEILDILAKYCSGSLTHVISSTWVAETMTERPQTPALGPHKRCLSTSGPPAEHSVGFTTAPSVAARGSSRPIPQEQVVVLFADRAQIQELEGIEGRSRDDPLRIAASK